MGPDTISRLSVKAVLAYRSSSWLPVLSWKTGKHWLESKREVHFLLKKISWDHKEYNLAILLICVLKKCVFCSGEKNRGSQTLWRTEVGRKVERLDSTYHVRQEEEVLVSCDILEGQIVQRRTL